VYHVLSHGGRLGRFRDEASLCRTDNAELPTERRMRRDDQP
jgi:hypothetical protein